MDGPSKPIKVTVLVDGLAEQKTADGGQTVGQFITDLLPEDQKARADDYQLSPKDGQALDPGSRLEDDGIPDGAILALTKKDGGGGACNRPRP